MISLNGLKRDPLTGLCVRRQRQRLLWVEAAHFPHVVRRHWCYAAAVLRPDKPQRSGGIHTCTEGPWAAPSTRRFRWAHQDISKVPLWYETDNSPMVLCRHSCLHAVFRSCCAREGGRVWMWLSGFHVCFHVRSKDREVQGAKVSESTWINKYMDTKTARKRKRMSDVKEAVEAPPEGPLLSVSFMHCSLTNCSMEWPGESEETPFYIWLCICIYFSFPSSFHFLTPAQPSSRLHSSFAAPRCLCAIIWSSLKDFP